MNGFIGIKEGQTRIFNSNGKSIPVTIVKYFDNLVTQIKTKENDNYNAIQISSRAKKSKYLKKSQIGHFKKSKNEGFYYTREFREMDGYDIGDKINPKKIFNIGSYVDVTSISKGKGFSGNIKRHHHKIGPQSHGSGYHRGIGSMGPITQNRVFKQKKMPGQLGAKKVTIQNLVVIDINEKNKYLLLKGLVPGPRKNLIIIKNAVKKNSNFTYDFTIFSYKNNVETKEEIEEKSKKIHFEEEKKELLKHKSEIKNADNATKIAEERKNESNIKKDKKN